MSVPILTMPTPTPREAWVTLAPLLAARQSMRLWSAATGYDRGRRLATVTLPSAPAALPLYDRTGRTCVLGLDFDATRFGLTRVEHDAAEAMDAIIAVGGAAILDLSPTGGRHLWVPLWEQARLTVGDLRPLLEAMRARWPTLDITPMLNAATGCLTGPGSACRGGGHRLLITPLDEAVRIARRRCPPGLVGSLRGALTPPARPVCPARRPGVTCDTDSAGAGAGPAPTRFEFRDELPSPHARAFAVHGTLPTHRPGWTRSEARQNVLTWAVRCGWSLQGVRDRIESGCWPGMADAYSKYRARADSALASDWAAAQRWAARSRPLPAFSTPSDAVHDSPHQHKHTGGRRASGWLARALAWVRVTPTLSAQRRPAAQDLLQALAYGARLTGQSVVAMGGRWLSIAAGMLDEQTVWQILRTLRDTEGSPVRWVRSHVGRHADGYELVAPHVDGCPVEPNPQDTSRARPTAVAAVWKVIGRGARVVLETVQSFCGPDGAIRMAELLARTGLGRSTVYRFLDLLGRHRLISVANGWVTRTARTLDQVAVEHGVAALVAARVRRHRAERRVWWELLALWNLPTAQDCPPSERLPEDPLDPDQRERWLAQVMSTGPPDDPYAPSPAEHDEQRLLSLLGDVLGAVVLVDSGTHRHP